MDVVRLPAQFAVRNIEVGMKTSSKLCQFSKTGHVLMKKFDCPKKSKNRLVFEISSFRNHHFGAMKMQKNRIKSIFQAIKSIISH